MLSRAAIGILATCHNRQPDINAHPFVFDETVDAIYIESNARICFSVSEIGRQLPTPTTAGVGSEYASVIVFGHPAGLPAMYTSRPR